MFNLEFISEFIPRSDDIISTRVAPAGFHYYLTLRLNILQVRLKWHTRVDLDRITLYDVRSVLIATQR